MDIAKYWASVHAAMEGLPIAGTYYLTSLTTPDGGKAGRVMDLADRKQTAQLLAANSHRLALPAEIEQYLADEKSARAKLADIEMARKQQFAMPAEMTALLAALATQGDKKKEKS